MDQPETDLTGIAGLIDKYIQTLIRQIEDFPLVVTNDLHAYINSYKKGYVSGVITFLDDSTLTMIEVLIKSNNIIEPAKYRYHYMDNNQALQFRYDNAAHFKNLSSFPHHKHILVNDDERVIATPKPTLSQILDEISDYVFRNFLIL